MKTGEGCFDVGPFFLHQLKPAWNTHLLIIESQRSSGIFASLALVRGVGSRASRALTPPLRLTARSYSAANDFMVRSRFYCGARLSADSIFATLWRIRFDCSVRRRSCRTGLFSGNSSRLAHRKRAMLYRRFSSGSPRTAALFDAIAEQMAPSTLPGTWQ